MTIDEIPLTASSKADFSGIYTAPDPRPYFRTLGALDYRIPQLALPVFEAVLDEVYAEHGRYPTVLDVCCSYGVNSALLHSPVDPSVVADRYSSPALDALSADELAAADARLFTWRPELTVLGLDASQAAISYARRSGLLADGWCEDLESCEPTAALRFGVADVGMVICTGGYGYVGPATFDRLLRSVRRPRDLWLVVFVLRVFDFAPTAAVLAEYGLVTERLPGVTFAQRRFADAAEAEAARRDVLRRGLDPAGKEADGWFHADCYVARPAAQAARVPIGNLCPAAATVGGA